MEQESKVIGEAQEEAEAIPGTVVKFMLAVTQWQTVQESKVIGEASRVKVVHLHTDIHQAVVRVGVAAEFLLEVTHDQTVLMFTVIHEAHRRENNKREEQLCFQ